MNGLTDEWFDAHIKVVGTYVMQGDFYGEQLRRFMVEYYYHFDWARLKLTDSFASRFGDTRLEDGIDSVVLEDAFKAYEEKLRSEGCPVVRRITKVKQLNGIASQDEIKSAVLTASPLLGFDVNRHLRVDRLGQLTLRCFGTIDWEANKCMRATVNLEDASVSGVTETACTIK